MSWGGSFGLRESQEPRKEQTSDSLAGEPAARIPRRECCHAAVFFGGSLSEIQRVDDVIAAKTAATSLFLDPFPLRQDSIR